MEIKEKIIAILFFCCAEVTVIVKTIPAGQLLLEEKLDMNRMRQDQES